MNTNYKRQYNLTYLAWYGALCRCGYKGNRKTYEVSVCDEWLGDDGLSRFIEHIGLKPEGRWYLDRIDNTKGYMPGNVRWATADQSNQNRSCARMITYNGETLNLSEWARRTNQSKENLFQRLKKMSVEKALTTPTR
jgi:hypothetical protein